jgi:hypothetical protein
MWAERTNDASDAPDVVGGKDLVQDEGHDTQLNNAPD